MLGTAGCIYHFRDVIMNGEIDAFFLMFSDVFCDYPLAQMIKFKEKFMSFVMMTVKVRYVPKCSSNIRNFPIL